MDLLLKVHGIKYRLKRYTILKSNFAFHLEEPIGQVGRHHTWQQNVSYMCESRIAGQTWGSSEDSKIKWRKQRER